VHRWPIRHFATGEKARLLADDRSEKGLPMPCTHEFGILDEFDRRKVHNDHEPHKYHCISVDDDLVNDLIPDLSGMKTYFHSFDRPECGLAHWGVTIIPVESLSLFYDVVASSKNSHPLHEPASKIMQAKNKANA
jgi:hypothetical protein